MVEAGLSENAAVLHAIIVKIVPQSLCFADGPTEATTEDDLTSLPYEPEAMSRTTVNFLLDTLLLAAFTSLAATSVIVRFVFPPGTQADRWTLWGHDYDAWVGLQFNILTSLALGILLHLMLHWSWICGVAANRLSKWFRRTIRIDEANQTVYGVGLLVVLFTLIGLVAAVASLQIKSDATGIPATHTSDQLSASAERRQPNDS